MFWYKCTIFTQHIMPDLKPVIYGGLQSVLALLLMPVMCKRYNLYRFLKTCG